MNLNEVIESTRNVARFRHLSYRTEQSYLHWVKRYAHWCASHPIGEHTDKLRAFLSHLAIDRHVSKSTQAQALNALVFLYRHVLQISLGDIGTFKPATRPKHLPVVLSVDETKRLLSHMHGTTWLIASLLYGSGLRLNEALSIRVQDIDLDRGLITIRAGKGDKDRGAILPGPLSEPLRQQIANVGRLHLRDLSDGFGEVYLPNAIERKYPPANKSLAWQYVFPASKIGPCPRTGVLQCFVF